MSSCPPDKLETVKDVLIQTMESLGEKPFTTDEVNKAKLRHKRSAELLQSNGQMMGMALSSAASRGDWRLLFLQRDRIANVTAADVNRVAKTYFQKQNRTLGMYVPTKQATRLSIPEVPSIAAIVKDYKGGKVAAAGEAFDPTPANLDARTKLLDEGKLKIGMLQKKNRGQTVSLVITMHYGNPESLKGLTTAAGMLPGMMMAGTKKHDRQELREELESLGVTIRPGAGGGFRRGGRRGGGGGGGGSLGQLTFSVEAKRDTLPQALTLLKEILREPAFPDEEFDTTKSRMRSMLSSGRTEPAALANNKLGRSLSPYLVDDVRYAPTLEESLARVKSVHLSRDQKTLRDAARRVAGRSRHRGRFRSDDHGASSSRTCSPAGHRRCPSSGSTTRSATTSRAPPKTSSRPTSRTPNTWPASRFAMSDNDTDYPAMLVGQLHLRRQHAGLADRRPHPAEGRSLLRSDLRPSAPRRAIRSLRSRSPSAPTRSTSAR